MISQNPRLEIYDPKTLAVMDKAFHAVWQVLKTNDPFRDYANDSELRIGRRLMELVANGGNSSCAAWIPHLKEPASAPSLTGAFRNQG